MKAVQRVAAGVSCSLQGEHETEQACSEGPALDLDDAAKASEPKVGASDRNFYIRVFNHLGYL